MSNETIRVLYVNETERDVDSISECLLKFEGAHFDIIWQQKAEKAITFLEQQNAVDVIVTGDLLQGMSGI